MFRKISVFLVLAFLLSLRCGAISARGYALIEQETGRLLEGRNVTQELAMASTTKIMTGLLACESGRLDETFTVPGAALRVEGSSMGLVAGEKLTLREITYGLLLESGNDAANTIAFLLSGSVPAFAEKMNERAASLGLKHTHFQNPSGLDGQWHYTCALDLARLGAAAMKNAEFRKIASTYKIRVPYDGQQGGRLLVNHNELLKMYGGTIGIKTGYTRKSGRCLVSCARRGGVTLVAATLNGRDDWNDHMALLNAGFGTVTRCRLLPVCPVITAHIAGGRSQEVRCVYDGSLEASLKADEFPRVKMVLNMRPFTYAPVEKGQKLGELIFMLDGIALGETDLIAADAVAQQKPNKFKDFWLSIFH